MRLKQEDTGLSRRNSSHTPMELGVKLSKSESEREIDATSYKRTVGCLRYLLHTRPDLSFSVGVLSRYMQSPRESHGIAMKQVLRYLQGSSAYGLVFKRTMTRIPKFLGYSDSSYSVDSDDGKSTIGHIFYLALSWCEAEFMAGTEAARQAIWLQDLMSEVTGQQCEKVMIRIDNQSAIPLTRNPAFHEKSKHIHRRYHFIRECVENGQVEVEYVQGDKQKADILTKALGRIRFKEMREFIGLRDLTTTDYKLKEGNIGLSLQIKEA